MPNILLNDILKDNILRKINNNIAHLSEKVRNAGLKSIKIANIPNNAVLLYMDDTDTQKIFKSTKGENKRCDYLLIMDDTVLFLEMKTDSKAPEHYQDECIMKFNAVDCLMAYIDIVINRIYGKERIYEHRKKRFVLFYKAPSIAKTTTSLKPARRIINDTPENMLTLPVDNDSTIDISKLNISIEKLA